MVTLVCDSDSLEGLEHKTQHVHLATVSYTQVVWNVKHKEWPLNSFIRQMKHQALF